MSGAGEGSQGRDPKTLGRRELLEYFYRKKEDATNVMYTDISCVDQTCKRHCK